MHTGMQYDGGKNNEGVYQKIINQVPPHDVKVDAFFGSGAITRHMLPAVINVGIERDPLTVKQFHSTFTGIDLEIITGDAVRTLTQWIKQKRWSDKRVFVYADPPYLRHTRSYRSEKIYRCEFDTPEDHARLLKAITKAPPNWMVAISGYDNDQYNHALEGWRKISFQVQGHKKPKTETLWMNYPEPQELHDYRYVGNDYREREHFKKRKKRFVAKVRNMKPTERYALMSALEELHQQGPQP